MNSLRVRLSLAFIGVVVLVLVAPVLIYSVGRTFGIGESGQMPAVLQSLPPEQLTALASMMERLLLRQFLLYFVATAVIGSIAGLIVSRSLTAPLQTLAAAARDIGQGDLSRRVSETGSQEIRDVAHAFNDMAHDLENAEALRQNLLTDVAHELRTPLTVVQGNLRAILDDIYPLEKEEVARIYDQTRLLTRLIDDLRTLAQAEARRLALNLVDVEVASLVKDTAVAFKPIATSSQIELRIELLGALPTITADRDRLAQCVQNLVINAIQHTPPGGTVTVQAEKTRGELQIRVCDTGHGIAPEHLDHVFDRFYRTDAARSRENGGTGLGLAIVRALVEAHGGRVSASSPGTNQGSTFVMHFALW